jgi:hypothetical protein
MYILLVRADWLLLLHALRGCDYINGGVLGLSEKKAPVVVRATQSACQAENIEFGSLRFYDVLALNLTAAGVREVEQQVSRIRKGIWQ